MKTTPVPVVRQQRPVRIRDVTTIPVGKMVPISAFALLREDGCSGRLNVAAEMSETFEVLMNRSFIRYSAWFVPHVANERFQRNATFFERSFSGEPMTNEDGADVIPYLEVEAHPAVGTHQIFKHLGIAYPPGTMVGTGYTEAYNQIVNYVRRNRSKSLDEVLMDNTALVPALWGDSAFSDIVPDFDDAMIAGELPLTTVQAKLPIKGLSATGTVPSGNVTRADTGEVVTGANHRVAAVDNQNGTSPTPWVYAELAEDGVTVSLANIDQARELIAWAKAREGYEGHKDSWVIDQLLAGYQVEDQQWFYPMLLDQKLVEIKQLKQMATDGPSLEEGVARGSAATTLGINVPPNTYGGVVMIIAEVMPEQLYERQADPYLSAQTVDDLPNYFRDVTNPMPVVEVHNGEIDVSHSTPNGLFGWARRNWKWASWPTRVGGDLFAPNADTPTTVARRAIWATDVANPTLSEEFYLTTTLGNEVFVDQDANPIKVGIGGMITVTGLTVIGEVHESEANYEEIRSKVPPLQIPAGA